MFITLYQARETGKIFNISNGITKISIETARTGSAGRCILSALRHDNTPFQCGDCIKFFADDTVMFYGYIFKIRINQKEEIELTCYDQLKYLLAQNSYLFISATASDIIKKIASDFKLKTGNIIDTKYKIPSFVKEDASCLDIIEEALQITTLATGEIYCFYDDNGELNLKRSRDMIYNIQIGDKSLMSTYDYVEDISSNTFNRIKLVRPNEETGRTDVYIVEDSGTMDKWGVLQYYEKVDENLNPAQIEELAKQMLKYYNVTDKKLTINSVGLIGLRAGGILQINVEDLKVKRFVLIDKAVHTFKGNFHETTIETNDLQEVN